MLTVLSSRRALALLLLAFALAIVALAGVTLQHHPVTGWVGSGSVPANYAFEGS